MPDGQPHGLETTATMANLTTVDITLLYAEILGRNFHSVTTLLKSILFWIALGCELVLSIFVILVAVCLLVWFPAMQIVSYKAEKAEKKKKREEAMAKNAQAATQRQPQIDLEAGSAVDAQRVATAAVGRIDSDAATHNIGTVGEPIEGPEDQWKDAGKSTTEEAEEKHDDDEAKEESSKQSTLGQDCEAPIDFSHGGDDHGVHEDSSTPDVGPGSQPASEEYSENAFHTDNTLAKSRGEILDELERARSRPIRDIDDDDDDDDDGTSDESARELLAPSDDEEIYGTRGGHGGWW